MTRTRVILAGAFAALVFMNAGWVGLLWCLAGALLGALAGGALVLYRALPRVRLGPGYPHPLRGRWIDKEGFVYATLLHLLFGIRSPGLTMIADGYRAIAPLMRHITDLDRALAEVERARHEEEGR